MKKNQLKKGQVVSYNDGGLVPVTGRIIRVNKNTVSIERGFVFRMIVSFADVIKVIDAKPLGL